MSIEQQFMTFLTSLINEKADRIVKQTANETASIAAKELRDHVTELSKAVDALFSDGRVSNRRGRRPQS